MYIGTPIYFITRYCHSPTLSTLFLSLACTTSFACVHLSSASAFASASSKSLETRNKDHRASGSHTFPDYSNQIPFGFVVAVSFGADCFFEISALTAAMISFQVEGADLV